MTVLATLSKDQCQQAAELMVAEGTPWSRYGLRVESALEILDAGIDSNASIVAANENNDLLGFAWYQTQGTFFHAGYLRILVVAAAARGSGVATQLMDHVEGQVFALTPNVFLLVSEWNTQ